MATGDNDQEAMRSCLPPEIQEPYYDFVVVSPPECSAAMREMIQQIRECPELKQANGGREVKISPLWQVCQWISGKLLRLDQAFSHTSTFLVVVTRDSIQDCKHLFNITTILTQQMKCQQGGYRAGLTTLVPIYMEDIRLVEGNVPTYISKLWGLQYQEGARLGDTFIQILSGQLTLNLDRQTCYQDKQNRERSRWLEEERQKDENYMKSLEALYYRGCHPPVELPRIHRPPRGRPIPAGAWQVDGPTDPEDLVAGMSAIGIGSAEPMSEASAGNAVVQSGFRPGAAGTDLGKANGNALLQQDDGGSVMDPRMQQVSGSTVTASGTDVPGLPSRTQSLATETSGLSFPEPPADLHDVTRTVNDPDLGTTVLTRPKEIDDNQEIPNPDLEMVPKQILEGTDCASGYTNVPSPPDPDNICHVPRCPAKPLIAVVRPQPRVPRDQGDVTSPADVTSPGDVTSSGDVTSPGDVTSQGDITSQDDVTLLGDGGQGGGAPTSLGGATALPVPQVST